MEENRNGAPGPEGRETFEQLLGEGGLLHHLFHHSTEGFLALDFRTLYTVEVNDAFCRMLGRARAELIGQRPDAWLAPEDRETFWKTAVRRAEQDSHQYEARLVARDGTRVPVLANASTWSAGPEGPALSLVFVSDLTCLKRSEELTEQLMHVLESFPGLIGMCDGNLNFLYHNAYAKELLGADRAADLTVRGCHPDWAFHIMREEAFPTAANEGYWVGESALLDQTGREVPFLVTVVAHHDRAGGVRRYSLVGIDQSVQNLAEEKKHRYAEQLRSISRLISLEGLTSLLAHQLNQPLAALGNYAVAGQRLVPRECPESPRLQALLDNIQRETQKASDTLVQVRKFLKGEGPDFHSLDLNDLVRRLPPFLQEGTASGRVPVRLHLAEGPVTVVGDHLQLQEVLHNLIHNAREANREQRPEDPGSVQIHTRRRDGEALVDVVDAGPGLPPEMGTDVLVRPFFTTKKGGIGLGLWVAYTILEGHKGRLEAFDNPDGPGATFRVRLPAEG
ncbi:MAG: ATP-binding protein [Thiohalorhabdus sp.]